MSTSMTLRDSLEQARQQSPQRSAVVCEDRSLTYDEFGGVTTRLAAGLLAGGLVPGDRVALHMLNSIEMAAVYYACFSAGLVPVPINARLKAPEIEFILNHSGARAYLGLTELYPEVERTRTQCSSLEQVYLSGTESFQRLYTGASLESRLPKVSPSDLAAILYTSGTTDRPKGVMHTHASLLAQADIIRLAMEQADSASFLQDGAGVLVMTPMAHMSGLHTLVTGLALGKVAVLLPRFDPDAALDTFERRRCTLAVGLPLMYKMLLDAQCRKPRDLSSASFWAVAGDSVPLSLLETFERICGKPLCESHAMTEALPNTWNRPGRIRAGSMGEPEPLVQIRVVDDHGVELPPGEQGEMLVHSPSVMSGYWRDPDGTAAALKDGWLRTGDIVRVDKDGYFWFVGRRKEIIKRGGNKISAVEIEAVLLQHPAVAEAGVVGVPDELYGERIAAYICLRTGSQATGSELIAFAGDRLAAYKVPEYIGFLEMLPKGITGKVQRYSLREMALSAFPKDARARI